jgi:quinol monooxygenase YgiN
MTVHLVASFRAVPGGQDAVRELITAYSTEVVSEPGCQRFDVYVDREDAAAFTVVEAYEDDAAFAAHLADARNASFNAALAPHVTGGGSTLRFLEAVTP